VGREFFADHHRYRAREVEHLAQAARRAGAEALGTTAKDAVRLVELAPKTPDLPIRVLRGTVAFVDEARFRRQLFAAAGRAA
jgi:tetraacyldisaccharide-1-P 4'-kinase